MTLGGRLIIVVVIQTLLLAGMIAKRQWTLNTGTPVVLETRPVDPRSLFRGDYVRFNYAIGTLRLETLAGDDQFRRNDQVYVTLKEGKPYWQAVGVHHVEPALAPGEVAIKGEVLYSQDRVWNPETSESEPGKNITVRYGIEEYFVPEGEGRRLERPTEGEVISLRIAVDRFGSGAIQALLINGVEHYRETLF